MPGNRRGGGNCPTDDFFSAKPHNAGAAGVSGASRTDPHRTTGALAFLLYFFPSTCSVSVLHCLACMFRIPCHQNDILLLRCSADLLCHSCFLVEKDSDLA